MSDLSVWSSWVGGIAVGLFAVSLLWVTGKQFGCSSSYCHFWSPVSRLRFFRNAEFRLDSWRVWFILGVPLGGLLAALTSPGHELELSLSMGVMYDAVMPTELWQKVLLLFSGGICLGLGARLAGGCTSGHVITGVALLNPPSMLAGTLFFIGGLFVAQSMFWFLS